MSRPCLTEAEEATKMAQLEQELKFLPERKRSKNMGLTIPGNWSFEIRRISPVKSTQNLIKASVSAKTLQFDECRVGAMTKDFMKSAWNPPDFKIMSFLRDDQV